MEYQDPTFELFGLVFNASTMLMVTVTATIVFVLCYFLGRNAVSGRPSPGQNLMEWMIDFIRGLAASTMDIKRGAKYIALALTLFLFILVGNMLSVPFKVYTSDYTLWWNAPTSDPHVTLTLAVMVIVMTHLFGLKTAGIREYFAHYAQPSILMMPLHIIEEFAKALTLGLRLFGNIFAKETLAGMIAATGGASVIWAATLALPLLAWQAFSIFMGAIQAFIFTILTLVYIAQKVDSDH